jgi:hypothetical protein
MNKGIGGFCFYLTQIGSSLLVFFYIISSCFISLLFSHKMVAFTNFVVKMWSWIIGIHCLHDESSKR